MKEKLTIEHLAAYLPYELKVMQESNPISIMKLSIYEYPSNDTITINSTLGVNEMIGCIVIKPILRPMSDLSKHKDILKELSKLYNLEFLLTLLDKLDLSITPYVVVQILLKNHFDVFHLIDKGLAIDTNTIKTN